MPGTGGTESIFWWPVRTIELYRTEGSGAIANGEVDYPNSFTDISEPEATLNSLILPSIAD